MDVRNVQKTGDMLYLYLPTRWCKQYGISGKSKVGVQINNDGSLGVYAQAVEGKPIHLNLKTGAEALPSLHKLIVACYISPADSFKITLEKGIDFTKVLDQKNLLSLELVEIDGNHITCESSMVVSDPYSLLTTMLRKVKNLLLVISKSPHEQLIERYEEEIDRSRLLIEKSVVASMVNPAKSTHRTIELHFVSLIGKELERMVDHLIALRKPAAKFVGDISQTLAELQKLLEAEGAGMSYQAALRFAGMVGELQGIPVKDVASYDMRRVVRALNGMADVIIDWAVIKEIEKTKS